MELEIQQFILYLENIKKTSENTRVSYENDLHKLQTFLKGQSVQDMNSVTITNLNSYILYLEKQKFASSTITRNVAAIKSFYQYLVKSGKVKNNVSEELKGPKVEKKIPLALSEQEAERLLEQPKVNTGKGMRDKAMLELMCATGIRVSELIALQLKDVNLLLGYIVCRDGEKERVVSCGDTAGKILENYIKEGRKEMLGEKDTDYLFVNCSGGSLSRQGVWKMMKTYAKKAGIMTEITPDSLRCLYKKAHPRF